LVWFSCLTQLSTIFQLYHGSRGKKKLNVAYKTISYTGLLNTFKFHLFKIKIFIKKLISCNCEISIFRTPSPFIFIKQICFETVFTEALAFDYLHMFTPWFDIFIAKLQSCWNVFHTKKDPDLLQVLCLSINDTSGHLFRIGVFFGHDIDKHFIQLYIWLNALISTTSLFKVIPKTCRAH
jgi:hypothetical protein